MEALPEPFFYMMGLNAVELLPSLLLLTKFVRFREKCWISQNRHRQGPKFRKLQEVIWLTVAEKIFKFPPQ